MNWQIIKPTHTATHNLSRTCFGIARPLKRASRTTNFCESESRAKLVWVMSNKAKISEAKTCQRVYLAHPAWKKSTPYNRVGGWRSKKVRQCTSHTTVRTGHVHGGSLRHRKHGRVWPVLFPCPSWCKARSRSRGKLPHSIWNNLGFVTKYSSTITCPECGFQKDEIMPGNAWQFFSRMHGL